MYMVVYDKELYGTALHDVTAGSSLESPDAFKAAIGINSYYIRVDSVSCSGCASLQNLKCYQPAEGIF